MAALDSQNDLIKALVIQCGGSSFISRDALEQAIKCDLDMTTSEKGITLTAQLRKRERP